MKNADAGCGLDSGLRMRAANQRSRLVPHTSVQVRMTDRGSVSEQDSSHGRKGWRTAGWIKAERSACMVKLRPRADDRGTVGPYRRTRGRQIEFSPAVETDPVSTVLDREHTAQVMMPAAKKKLEDTPEQFHKSCARWRRSQLPFASSHSRRERTLARARAIAQSAAP